MNDTELRAETERYLRAKVRELQLKLEAREAYDNGTGPSLSRDYSQKSIRELREQIRGSLKLACQLRIVNSYDDFYGEIRKALDGERWFA
jgi:hypothetical protein